MSLTGAQIAFLAFAGLTSVFALLVVTSRNLFHAALWLVAAFTGVACIYVLLHADFVAMSQIIVYVGAIAVLMMFAVFLTEDVVGRRSAGMRCTWFAALPVAAPLLTVLVRWAVRYPWKNPHATPPPGTAAVIGAAFIQRYLFAFELASVVLLAALIGAILLAKEDKP